MEVLGRMLRLRCYWLGLLFLSAGWAADPADKAEKTQESAGFPSGMVAMFSGASCPEGWTNEPLTQGRIPIGAATPAESGEIVGEPFVEKKPVLHQHAYLFATEITGSVMPASGPFTAVQVSG